MYVGLGIIKAEMFQLEWLREGEILFTEGELGLVCLPSLIPNSIESIRQYNDSLCHIIQHTTIIPLRFGTLFEDESEIHKVLRDQYKKYIRLLKELNNLIEVGLTISWEQEQFAQDILGDKTLARWKKALESGKGQGYDVIEFGKAVEELADKKRKRIEKQVLEILSPLAKAYRIKDYTDELQGFNGVFLVPRAKEEEFDQAVDILLMKYSSGYQFKYTGPWPAHHFI